MREITDTDVRLGRGLVTLVNERLDGRRAGLTGLIGLPSFDLEVQVGIGHWACVVTFDYDAVKWGNLDAQLLTEAAQYILEQYREEAEVTS